MGNSCLRQGGDVLIQEDDLTAAGFDIAGNQLKKGAFPSPVGANDGLEIPFLDGKGDFLDGRQPPKFLVRLTVFKISPMNPTPP